MSFRSWLYHTLKQHKLSVAELEKLTIETAQSFNEDQIKLINDKLKVLQEKSLQQSVYEQEKYKIMLEHSQRMKAVSKATIFRLLSDDSIITPRKTTIDTLKLVLEKYGAYTPSDFALLYTVSDDIISREYYEAHTKQRGLCFICEQRFSDEDYAGFYISLVANHDYEFDIDYNILKNKKTSIFAAVCSDCSELSSRVEKWSYVDIVNKIFPKYQSQESIAKYLNTNQPTISKLKRGKLELISEELAVTLFKKAAIWLKEKNGDAKVENSVDDEDCKVESIDYMASLISKETGIPGFFIEKKYNRIKINEHLQLSDASKRESSENFNSITLNFDLVIRDKIKSVFVVGFFVECSYWVEFKRFAFMQGRGRGFSDSQKSNADWFNTALLKGMLVNASYIIFFSEHEHWHGSVSEQAIVFEIERDPFFHIHGPYDIDYMMKKFKQTDMLTDMF